MNDINKIFANVCPKTFFYVGIGGTRHSEKCIKLFCPTLVRVGKTSVPFRATAVSSKSGVPLDVEMDEMISFTPSLVVTPESEDVETPQANRMEIPIVGGYYFAEGLQKGKPVRAYNRKTGQLV
jgi:hypothetical protein